MGKNFAQKLANLFLTFVMVCSCLFVFSACKNDKDKTSPTKATITSISVDVAENSNYTMVEKTIEVNYSSNKRYRFEASDFVVTAIKSDNTTTVLSQKTDTADGYTLDSTVSTATPTPVDEYKLTFGYTGVENVEIKVKVNKGIIDVSGVTLENKTYNGSVQTLTTADVKNLPENVTAEFVEESSGTNAQTYDAELSFTYTGSDAESFETIPNRTISWVMNKASYDVSGISWNVYQNNGSADVAVADVNSIVYNGKDYLAKISGDLPDGVTVRGYNLNATQKNAGTYTASVQFNFDNVNYNTPAVQTYSYTIKKAGLTVTANDKNITFTDEPSNSGVSYSGFVDGESETTDGLIKGELVYDYSGYIAIDGSQHHKTYTVGADVGIYPIKPAGISADNYNITFVNGKLTVESKNYDYSNLSITFAYNSESPFTYNGQIQRPAVTGVPNYVNYSVVVTANEEIVSNPKNVGTYTGTFTPDVSSRNYTFTGTAPTVEYVINKKALTIRANDKTINFGDEASNAGVLLTGLVAGEILSDVTTGELIYKYSNYIATSNVGTYPITVEGLSSTNYEITYQPGTLTVAKKQLNYSEITLTGSETAIYDGEEHKFAINGKPAYVQASIVYKNSNNETVTVPKDADTYTATFTVVANNNYEFLGTTPTKTLVISKKALTITAENKTITWSDAVPEYTVTYSGFVTGENKDTESIFSGTLAFDCTYTAGSNAGTYDIVPRGLSAKNYEITFVNGTLTVSKITYNYSDLSWKIGNKTATPDSETGFVLTIYNALAQKPTIDGFNQNITFVVVYNVYNSSTQQPGEEVANPTNVGEYIATLTFTDSTDNYEFTGTPISSTLKFKIEQKEIGTAELDKAKFVVKKVSDSDSSSTDIMVKGNGVTDTTQKYKANVYYEEGYHYEISFKNELDANLTFDISQNETLSIYSTQDEPYTFTATVSGLTSNYSNIKETYTLYVYYELIISKLNIGYISKPYEGEGSSAESKGYSEYGEFPQQSTKLNLTNNEIFLNGFIMTLSGKFADEGDSISSSVLNNEYTCEFSIDRENTTALDIANYNHFENTIYLIIRRTSGSVVVCVIPIKIRMTVELTYSDSTSSGSSKNYMLEINSTSSSLTTDIASLTFAFDSSISSRIDDASIEFAKYTDSSLSENKTTAISLENGSNLFRIYITFTDGKVNISSQTTYTYSKDIAIIYSVSSNYFNISYSNSNPEEGGGSSTGSNVAQNNSINVNVNGVDDFAGENATTSITEIFNNISISAKSAEDLGEGSEKTYTIDEESKTIECVNGKVYVVIDVNENSGAGSENPVEPEPTGISNYNAIALYDNESSSISIAKKLYILLNLPFDVDYNTNAIFSKDVKDDGIDADAKTIEMMEYESLSILLENENAIIEVTNNDTNQTKYIVTYGLNPANVYFEDGAGSYTLTIKPTAVILGGFIQGGLESYYNVWNINVLQYVPDDPAGIDRDLFFTNDHYPNYPRFDFNDHIDSNITKIEIKVNDKIYSLENDDIYYDDNIYTVSDRKFYKEFLVRLTDKLSALKDAQTGKVTIQNFTLEGWGEVELYYLEAPATGGTNSGENDNSSNVVSEDNGTSSSSESGVSSEPATPNFVKITETSFALSVVSHYEFGDTVEFYIKKGSDYYKFTVVFDDSFPTFDGINPYTKPKPESLDKFSITLKDKDNNSHTYSTDTNNFYYSHFEGTVNNVYQYEMYMRMDIETSDVTSHLYKVGTSDREGKFIDCDDITFDFADDGLFANATLETYKFYAGENNYIDYSEKRIVDEHLISSWGECLELTAHFTVGSGDDAETFIWTVYLIFKNSMPIPSVSRGESDEGESYFSSYVEGIAGDDEHKGFGIDCAIDDNANLVGDFILTDSDPGKMLEFTAYIGEDKLAYTNTTGEGADAVTELEFTGIMFGASVVKTTYMIDCNKETNNQIELTEMEYGASFLVAMAPKFVVKNNQIKIKVINNEGETNESIYYFIIVFGTNPTSSND